MSDGEQVRVNSRASNTPEGRYTVPDSRVGDVAFDVSLTAKTLRTQQIQDFFRSDFRPSIVVIVRPRALGADATYAITNPNGR